MLPQDVLRELAMYLEQHPEPHLFHPLPVDESERTNKEAVALAARLELLSELRNRMPAE
jgi:hypothetical protein